MPDRYRIGLDIGGTFTDLVLLDDAAETIRLHKVLTTSPDPAAGALTGDAYEPPDGPPGRPGLRRWTFKATQPGQERIDLTYVRPWQQDQPPARTFTLHVQVSS